MIHNFRILNIMNYFKKLFIIAGIGLSVPCAFAENAIESEQHENNIPTEFERNLDNLSSSWYIKSTVQHKECKSNSENPSFSAQVYADRLAKLPTVIPMPYNERVRELIDFYANRRRTQVERMLGLSRYYFPIFEQKLSAAGMPLELRYLPVIESALNPSATSRVGAAGLWQFMPATGRIYDLEISSLVDERRDPIKSSLAGATFLNDLYRMYGDWHLAIAAYNCGPGNVNKAIRRSGGKRTFWEIYDYLPRETRGYVPAFIAANYIMTYYKEHGLCPMEVTLPKYSDTIVVREKLELSKIAHKLKINPEELQAMNPQLKTDVVPGHIKPHTLYFPDSYAGLFIANIDSIRVAKEVVANADSIATESGETMANIEAKERKPKQPAKITHNVRSGETLSGIADKYGVTVRNIMEWNNLKSNRAMRGQKLTIHTNKKGVSSSSSSSSKPQTITYVVRRGDNLTAIAKRHRVTVDAIKKANNLKSTKLSVGQKLKIPKK